MKLNRKILRKMILNEIKALNEAYQSYYEPVPVETVPTGTGAGDYEFYYTKKGDNITVYSGYFTPKGGGRKEKIETKFLGPHSGMIFDSQGLNIAQGSFENKVKIKHRNKNIKVSYDFSDD